MLVLECPSCQAKMQVAEEHVGKSTVCPTCSTSVKIPASEGISAEPMTAAPTAPADAITTPEQARAGKKPSGRQDDDDDQDDALPRRRERSSSGNGAAAVGLGIGMILLIVGGIAGAGVCVLAILIALLLPAVQKVREAAARTETISNMKQIALCCHAHNDVTKVLPSPKMSVGFNVPELSWRVTILPYMEQQGMFQQFDQNAGWDHPNNQRFLNQKPPVYNCPWRPATDLAETRFQYFTGPNTLFPQPTQSVNVAHIRDGSSNTFLFAEALTPVAWSRPADIVVPANGALPLPADRFLAAMADGSVRMVERSRVNEQVLRLVIDPNDGQQLPMDW